MSTPEQQPNSPFAQVIVEAANTMFYSPFSREKTFMYDQLFERYNDVNYSGFDETLMNDGSFSCPITDVLVVGKDEPIPEGYELISGSSAHKIRVNIVAKHGNNSDKLCVIAVSIISKKKGEKPPPGFVVIETTPRGNSANLCYGNEDKALYLCIKRMEHPKVPLVDLCLLSLDDLKDVEDNFVALGWTPTGIRAKIIGKGPRELIYLGFKKNWSAIEVLRRKKVSSNPVTQKTYETRMDMLAPFLYICHSGSVKGVSICLEQFQRLFLKNYLILDDAPAFVLVEYVLDAVLCGALTYAPSVVSNLVSLLLYAAGSCKHGGMPASTMRYLLGICRGAMMAFYFIMDRSVGKSLLANPANVQFDFFFFIDALLEIGESASVSMVGEKERALIQEYGHSLMSETFETQAMLRDIESLVTQLDTNSCVQNVMFTFIFLISCMRVDERSLTYQMVTNTIKSTYKFQSWPLVTMVYQEILGPAFMLSLSRNSSMDYDYFRNALELVVMIWRFHRSHLQNQIGIILNFLVSLMNHKDVLMIMKTCALEFFCQLFQGADSLYTTFIDYDFGENAQWHVLSNVLSTISGLVSQVSTLERPSVDDLKVELRLLELVRILMRGMVDLAGNLPPTAGSKGKDVAAVENAKEKPIVSGQMTGEGGIESDPHKARIHEMLQQAGGLSDVSARNLNDQLKVMDNVRLVKEALKIAKTEGVKKCISYLLARGYMKRDSQEIVKFIFMHLNSFDEMDLGDYLGSDGGTTTEETDLMNQIRMRYINATNWKGLSFDSALRYFLTKAGFRLPGEAQKISRLASTFAQSYWEDNKESFSDPDSVFFLTFATIMLNADAHNKNVKKENKMTHAQFVSNLRGGDNGADFPRDMLTELYWSIVNEEIKMPNELTKKDIVIELDPSTKHMLAVNSCIHCSIALFKEIGESKTCEERTAEGTRALFECMWWEIFFTLEVLLPQKNLSQPLIDSSLTCLISCVSASWFLDMSVPCRAFIDIIRRQIPKSHDDDTSVKLSEYVAKISMEDEPLDNRMALLHMLIETLKMTMSSQVDQDSYLQLQQEFVRGSLEVNESRKFIRKGIVQRKTRKAALITYTFYLFNDLLLYASKTMSGKYKPHLSVLLSTCKVTDVFGDEFDARTIRISTNVKPIIMVFSTVQEKKIWNREIKHYIAESAKSSVSRNLNASTQPFPIDTIAPSTSRSHEGHVKRTSIAISRSRQKGDELDLLSSAAPTEARYSIPRVEYQKLAQHGEMVTKAINHVLSKIGNPSFVDMHKGNIPIIHSCILQLLYGNFELGDHASVDVQTLDTDTLKNWKELKNCTRERLTARFVSMLSVIDPKWREETAM